MAEAAIELLFEAEKVKRLGKVSPVKVRVDSEHLAEDHLANFDEALGEAGALAKPIPVVGVG